MVDNRLEAALQDEAISLTRFLADIPASVFRRIELSALGVWDHNSSEYVLDPPDTNIHCPDCGGTRNFAGRNKFRIPSGKIAQSKQVVTYVCRDCRSTAKHFALLIQRAKLNEEDEDLAVVIYKFGEFPEFGPPLPQKLLKLVGSERDHFFQGRSAERQGMGIAAFAYYRRVIDERKTKIFESIIKACQTLGAPAALMVELNAAKDARSFSDAIGAITIALPDALYVAGENPLTLLYSALSEGLHNKSDSDCLKLAGSIRVVLGELVARIDALNQESSDLEDAVKALIEYKDRKSK